jgi:hypothetical protein
MVNPMRYEILNDSGEVVNTILADEVFVTEHYPNRWRQVVGVIESTELVPAEPTKEELLAQLAELTAKIQAL